MPRVKKARLNCRLPPELLEEAKQAAESRHLTVTDLVTQLLVSYIEQQKKKQSEDAEQL